MLSQVDQTRLPSYRIGMQQGMQQGMQLGRLEGKEEGMQQGKEEGMQDEAIKLLERQIKRRFGPISEETRHRLQSADIEQLERWADNILDAQTLEEVFKD